MPGRIMTMCGERVYGPIVHVVVEIINVTRYSMFHKDWILGDDVSLVAWEGRGSEEE